MKGFFGFAVILAMITTLFFFCIAIRANTTEIEKSKNELIKAENANMEKTLLENNVDKIIYTKLSEEINNKNFRVKTVQNTINTALEKYLKERTNTTGLFFDIKGNTNKEQLNKNTVVIMLETNDTTYSEYTYVSTPKKDEIISTPLGNKIITYFMIPIGYTTRIVKIN